MRKTRGSLYPLAFALVAIFALAVFARPAELAEAHDGDSFKFSSATYSVNEGDTFTFFVQRALVSGTAEAHNVTVIVGEVGDTAVNGTHYGSSVGGNCPVQSDVGLVFAPGSSQQGFTIRTCAAADFLDRTFTLKIGTISNSGVPGTPATAIVTIEDVNGPQPPAVTSVSPSQGSTAGGTSVTILGSGFTGVDCAGADVGVFFGADDAASCTVVSPTRIDAVTQAHAAGDVEVTVTHPTNGTSSTAGSGNNFLFVTPGAPTVTSVNPASGAVGTQVLIVGTGFGASPTVTFGGVSAPGAIVNGAGTQITVNAPDPGVSTRPLVTRVVVTANALQSPDSANDDFTYANISVTGLSPSSGPAGINITITGTGFVSAPTVKFGLVDATVVTFSATTITVTVPTPDSTTRPLLREVVVSIGATSSANTAADDFTYVDVVITSISPQTGPPGTAVTITGSGFTAQPVVKFGTVTATVNTVTPTSIVASAPTQPTPPGGTVDVSVTVGLVSSADPGTANNFTYTMGVAVTALDPNKGPTAGGNTVKITGAGFLAAATITVSFGGTAATNVTRLSDTELTAVAPQHAAGVVSVIVTVNGAASPNESSDDYTYADIPVITSIDPASGNAGGTTIVKIIGLNFVEGSVVKFGAITATRTIVSPTEISAVAPSTAPPGTVDVTVTNAAGTSLVGPQTVFTFIGSGGLPTVTGLSPTGTGLNVSTTVVTVTGTNFSTPATVKFGTVSGTAVEVLSSTSLRVTAPASATAGTVDVTVTTTIGTSSASGSGNDFTYGTSQGGVTTTYQLFVRYTLLTWDGRDNITPFDALRGLESPDNPATNNILSAATAVFYWSGDGTGCPLSQACWQAFFPNGTGVPGANNLAALFRGRAYWVAVSFNITWTILRGQ